MTIVRAPRRPSRYTQIDNGVIEDERLSFKALGLLVYILSKPDHWNASREHLATTHADGQSAVRSALKELRDAGYITIEPVAAAPGRLAGRRMVVHAEPQNGAAPTGGKPERSETIRSETAPVVSTEVATTDEAIEPPAPDGTGPAQTSLLDAPASKGKPKGPHRDRANEIVQRVWERSTPKPATPFIGAVQIAERLLEAGHDAQDIGRAMVAVPTISTRWVEAEIARAKGKGNGGPAVQTANERQGIVTDRDMVGGVTKLQPQRRDHDG